MTYPPAQTDLVEALAPLTKQLFEIGSALCQVIEEPERFRSWRAWQRENNLADERAKKHAIRLGEIARSIGTLIAKEQKT